MTQAGEGDKTQIMRKLLAVGLEWFKGGSQNCWVG